MLRVPVQRLEPGMVLARPIPMPNEQGRTLLARGCQVPRDLALRLERHGVQDVWVACRTLEFLEEVIDAELADRQRDIYWTLRKNLQTVSGTLPQLDIPKLEAVVWQLYECLTRGKHSLITEKLDSCDSYFMSHSTNVCYLALLLGMKLERYLIDERHTLASRAKDARELGLGCLVHDIGKLKLPQAILNKPGQLTVEEMELVRKHPQLGYEMVKGRIPTSAAQVVLNHHQRFDGRGYPDRIDPKTEEKMPPLAGKHIPIFSRIAAICDVYDAATTARSYSVAKPPVQALWEMRTYFGGAFDPVVEAAFYEITPAFPVGSLVTLSDGSEAAVVDFRPAHALRPKVQRLRTPQGERIARPDLDEIDLSLADELSIVSASGVDVRQFVGSERETVAC